MARYVSPQTRRLDLLPLSVWALHIALPLLGLWLLLEEPKFDVRWQNQAAHFWLVLLTALASAAIAVVMSRAVAQREDARLFLVSAMFLVSAGFLALHALATPTVILEGGNAGFTIASPVGLVIGAVFAAASSVDFAPRLARAVISGRRLIIGVLVAAMVAWGVVSLLEIPPLDEPITAEEAEGPLLVVAGLGAVLYGLAAVRYYGVHRRRPAVMLLGVITAFVLLAEAMFAQALGRNWQASWWEWHVLMLLGFAFVAYSAAVHFRREGALTGLFRSISLEETVRRVQQDYQEALESLVSLVSALHEREEGDGTPIAAVALDVGERFSLTPAQIDVLEHAADALSSERRHITRLQALVSIGQQASVALSEQAFMDSALSLIQDAFPRDTFAVRLGPADEPGGQSENGHRILLPLSVKGGTAGVLDVVRPRGRFDLTERSLLEALAQQLSIALENVRLYGEVSGLFRQYMSSNVASLLVADPGQAALGGAVVEVSVLFADLGAYTTFSEGREPGEIMDMLNAYFGAAAPVVLAHGGTIDKFVGDALMALFNAPVRQPDHALRAARAALEMRDAVEALRRDHPGWPAFRIGVNTGPALVGNIGSAELRNYTAIGDTVNIAARLQAVAEPGRVVIGHETYQGIREYAVVEPLEELPVKGRREPVRAYVLRALREDSA